MQMYMVNPGGRGVQQLAASVELEGAQPVKLHGGNLLAVGTSQQLKSGVQASGTGQPQVWRILQRPPQTSQMVAQAAQFSLRMQSGGCMSAAGWHRGSFSREAQAGGRNKHDVLA